MLRRATYVHFTIFSSWFDCNTQTLWIINWYQARAKRNECDLFVCDINQWIFFFLRSLSVSPPLAARCSHPFALFRSFQMYIYLSIDFILIFFIARMKSLNVILWFSNKLMFLKRWNTLLCAIWVHVLFCFNYIVSRRSCETQIETETKPKKKKIRKNSKIKLNEKRWNGARERAREKRGKKKQYTSTGSQPASRIETWIFRVKSGLDST